MNGIIHPCSHPKDDDPHFRITEEQIFKDIFHYIECLFRIIRPRKVCPPCPGVVRRRYHEFRFYFWLWMVLHHAQK